MGWKDTIKPITADTQPSAPSSWKNTIQKEEVPSEVESALRGAAQGASLGFADELTGALEAGGEALLHPSKLTELAELYRKHRDESRRAYEAAESTNPLSYMGGQFAGGAATIPLMGPAGEAGAFKNILTAAKLGGIQGLGSSEADITKGEIGKAVGDIKTGAELGAVGGVAGETLGGIANYLKNKPIAEDIAKSYQFGKQGVKLGSTEEARGIAEDFINKIQKVGDITERVGSELGEKQAGILESATRGGVNLAEQLQEPLLQRKQQVEALLKNSDLAPETANRLRGVLKDIDNLLHKGEVEVPVYERGKFGGIPKATEIEPIPRESISPSELQQFKGEVKGKGILGQSPTGKDPFPAITSQYTGLGTEATQALSEGVPSLADVNAQISANKTLQDLTGHVKDIFVKKDLTKTEALANKLKELGSPGIKGAANRELYEQMLKSGQKIGDEELNTILKEFPDLADKYRLSQEAIKEGIGHGKLSLIGSLKAKAIDISNRAGAVAKEAPGVAAIGTGAAKVIPGLAKAIPQVATQQIVGSEPTGTENITAPLKNKTDNLYLASPDELGQVADKLIQNNISIGNALKDAVQSNDSDKKNRAIFTIMQNPKARKLINVD